MNNITENPYGKLHRFFDDNFMEYTSYVIKERAIPDINDGLKPVQRRILQTLFNMDDGRFQKVANVVGDAMKLHPHGDASIFGALVNLANKEYLIEKQGNFGNIYTGDHASAARYIECRLSPLAKETLFNRDLTDFTESYDGRLQEPVTLPAKLPILLLHGAEGIAVGMATKIMPHNFCELLEAQKNLLRNNPILLYPDFPQGGLLDVSGYEDGLGRLKCRAKIIEKNEKTIVIKEIPYNTTTQSLSDSIEKAAKSGKIKILSINDYTAEEVEIEIKLARGVYAKETIKALYAFTDCEISISPNLTLIRDNHPDNIPVSEVLKHNTDKLLLDLEKELAIEQGRLKEKLHAKLLEQIFIEERLYKKIEESKSYKAAIATTQKALEPYTAKLERPVSREDIERLLEIRIKRISRYDIDKQQKEIKEINRDIKKITTSLKNMVVYTIKYLDSLLKKYGAEYPRRTEIMAFKEVKARKVALSNLTTGYDMKNGMLGYHVKTDCDMSFACSEYDKILLINKDGAYKIINVTDKIFAGHDLIWVNKLRDNQVFNVIYRDGSKGMSYVKRFKTPKFILDKEYRLFSERKSSFIQFIQTGEDVRVRVTFAPLKRAKTNSHRIYMDDYLIKGSSAIGKRISPRVVRQVTELTGKVSEPKNDTAKEDPKAETTAPEVEQYKPSEPESQEIELEQHEDEQDKIQAQPDLSETKTITQLDLFKKSDDA